MNIVFYIFCFLVVFFALLTVASKNLVRSVFMFFFTLFSLAVLYIFSLADFVALTQIVVYVGGVLVLMLFGFMLSEKSLLNVPPLQTEKQKSNAFLLMGMSAMFFILLSAIWFGLDTKRLLWMQTPKEEYHQVKNIGIELMTKFLIPFELVSVFLLMALVGVVHLSGKKND